MYYNMHHICAGDDAAAVQPRCTRSGAGARGRGAGRREYDADRGATAQDAEVAALTRELGWVLQLPLTLAQPFTPARTRSRWQATYEREQGAPPSAQDTAASQVCINVTPKPSLYDHNPNPNPSRVGPSLPGVPAAGGAARQCCGRVGGRCGRGARGSSRATRRAAGSTEQQ